VVLEAYRDEQLVSYNYTIAVSKTASLIQHMRFRSHATYYFIAAGCYIATNNVEKAQELFDEIPRLIESKIAGKDLPTEVLIKKKSMPNPRYLLRCVLC
jgi:hypothetical protein